MIQYRVVHNDIRGGLGLALAHPLYYLIQIAVKYAVPLGPVIYRINLTNAVISALAVANLFLLLQLWLKHWRAALVGAMMLGLSHTFWRHATIPETYNLFICLLMVELILLLYFSRTGRKKYLYALALINGLSLSNHMLASIGWVCYVVLILFWVIRKKMKVTDMLIAGAFWLIGASVYLGLIITQIVETGDILATLQSAAFGDHWAADVMNVSLSARIVKENMMWIMLNFPTPLVVLVFVGLRYGWKVQSDARWFAGIIITLWILFFLFAFRYTVPDRYAFFIPFYSGCAILMALGAKRLLWSKHQNILFTLLIAFALTNILVYAYVPGVARSHRVVQVRRQIPYRDDYTYFLQPWRTGYDGARKFAQNALQTAGDNGIIYADGTTVYPLLLDQELYGGNRNVIIACSHGTIQTLDDFGEDVFDEILAQKDVFVVSPRKSYCPWFILENYDVQPAGVLWQVVRRDL